MPKLTYPEYLELEASSDQRLEYIAGVVRAMAGGTHMHAALSGAMLAELRAALAEHGCIAYSSDLKLRIDAVDRTTYADVVVICGPSVVSTIDRNASTNPTILVEVLSPSTEAGDRGEKWDHYQHFASLREYVLVSQDQPRIEVWSRDGGAWTTEAFGAGELFELPSHGVRIAVDAVYRGLREVAGHPHP